MSQSKFTSHLFDSAVLIALVTAILYFVGDSIRTSAFTSLGVPWDLGGQQSDADNMRSGLSLLLLILIFTIPIVDVVLLINKQWRDSILTHIEHWTIFRYITVVIYGTFILLLLTRWFSWPASTLTRWSVCEATLVKDTQVHAPIQRLYYVAKTDREFVFVDQWAARNPQVTVVAREQVQHLMLAKACE